LLSTTGDNTSITTTGANGIYAFTGLTPGVEYQVQFSKPAGSVYAKADTGNDASDTDANVTTGLSQRVRLASGQNNTTIDAGYYNSTSIAGSVYGDANNDGVKDAGETPIVPATVNLTGTKGLGVAVRVKALQQTLHSSEIAVKDTEAGFLSDYTVPHWMSSSPSAIALAFNPV
jgi:hypothetical protein